jgi:SIT4-associating protein SAP185/190
MAARPKEGLEPILPESNDVEAGEASIIVGHAAEAERHTPASDTPIGPVVGDYLKMQLVEHRVVPTILSFFFAYPWNNFLHNVVYDIVQQVFNGPMERGYNPTLAISLFEQADITTQIIKGQLASEQSQHQTKTRMGYMGHLTLIAEEVVKFTERHPPELLSETILEKVMAQDWINYVEGALAETRERDNAILGGVRPEVAVGNRAGAAAGLAAVGLGGLSSIGLGGGLQGASSALAEVGLSGGLDLDNASGNAIGPFAISGGTLMSGFGSSSDEDEDEDVENEEDVNNEVSYALLVTFCTLNAPKPPIYPFIYFSMRPI